jgi:hypothetical protein
LLVNVRINTLFKSSGLRPPELGLKALVRFDNVGFKLITRVSNKVLSGTKYMFVFGAY